MPYRRSGPAPAAVEGVMLRMPQEASNGSLEEKLLVDLPGALNSGLALDSFIEPVVGPGGFG